LTARERECLAWSAEGKTAWETGVILGISDQTVISHLRNAQRKMRAANRVQAVAMAIRAGLLEDVVEVPGDHGPVVIGDPAGR
jgi:DNA-binding CsgD family transcriptional regulator